MRPCVGSQMRPWCVFWIIILENIPHSNTNILLLDFRFIFFFFLIKYLVITSTEYDGSFCFEICQFWDARVRKRASRSSSELHNTKSSLYLLKYVLDTFTFSWWIISLSSGVVTDWLILNNTLTLFIMLTAEKLDFILFLVSR